LTIATMPARYCTYARVEIETVPSITLPDWMIENWITNTKCKIDNALLPVMIVK